MQSVNNLNNPGWRSHAAVVRCDDEVWMRILHWLNNTPNLMLVYSKSSDFKLVVAQEDW
jgi:hypothetical protein